jgi:Circularly permutated YpsA SLOG family
MLPTKIISGAQTGVDRAALDVAIAARIPHGGKIPKGRHAEDGTIDPTRYPNLEELPEENPDRRTEANIHDSDATLVILDGPPDHSPGTLHTLQYARQQQKPLLIIDLSQADHPTAVDRIQTFVTKNQIATLNIAGPRESQSPGIYRKAQALLTAAFNPPRAAQI